MKWMHRNFFNLLFTAIAYLSLQSAVYADFNQFLGEWKNVDPNTGSVAKFTITQSGKNLIAHFYGGCGGDYCDMGETKAIPYASKVCDVDLSKDATRLTAEYKFSWSHTTYIITPIQETDNFRTGRKLIQVIDITKFSDHDGRTNQSSVDIFYNTNQDAITKK